MVTLLIEALKRISSSLTKKTKLHFHGASQWKRCHTCLVKFVVQVVRDSVTRSEREKGNLRLKARPWVGDGELKRTNAQLLGDKRVTAASPTRVTHPAFYFGSGGSQTVLREAV